MSNDIMPGNPRYQPIELQGYWGYDYLMRWVIKIELAGLHALGESGKIPAADFALLTPEVEAQCLAITTTEVDRRERETRHDIRALVQLMQERLPVPLRRWCHALFTSYDPLESGRILAYVEAHRNVVRPKLHHVINAFANLVEAHAETPQIGRTHGQHALPITVGFWLASILYRIVYNAKKMDEFADELVGKISGAVGAYNAQKAFGVDEMMGGTFEALVLEDVGLRPAPISTQVLMPEPLTYYLFAATALSTALGQFGLDFRQLMRTEIAEVAQPFKLGQAGSSTMAQKRNPMIAENLQGMALNTKVEFMRVLESLMSEHQRDLVGSSLMRNFPAVVVFLTQQLDTLLREDKDDERPFISRITIDVDACKRNLDMHGDKILAEPMYLALQWWGYEGDAHKLISDIAMPLVGAKAPTLWGALHHLAESDRVLYDALEAIPKEMHILFGNPAMYTGAAADQARKIVHHARSYLSAS